jgi:GNAT superfamily N-acetyltransferase
MEFRIAQLTDCKLLSDFVNRAYRGDEAKSGWTTEADILDGIRTNTQELSELVAQPNNIILMAYLDQKLVGSVHLAKNGARCYLGMLTVDPHQQNKGIGKQLLARAKSEALNWGCQLIEITVITLRTELINFYLRHGFQATEKFIDFPSDPKFGVPKVADLQMQYFELPLR